MSTAVATDFPDEQTNPDARAPMHPAVQEWCELALGRAPMNYRTHADRDVVIADLERLLAFARGGTR